MRPLIFVAALVAGFILALVLLIMSPLLKDVVNRARQSFYLACLRGLADATGATMAAAPSKARQGARSGSQTAVLVLEHNRLCTAMDALLAKLDVNHGAAADHVATIGGTYARIAGNEGRDPNGTVVT
jgi:hypothetical protein